MELPLKDSKYRIIGFIQTEPDGKQIGKDGRYAIKGYFDPKTNETKDATYRIVGYGNLLPALIIGNSATL